MDRITVSNFRCFGQPQTARLAPITLLVGENSTGKTSLMAMVRALWDAVYENRVPNFNEPPFDLGSFDEIAHRGGAAVERAASFTAGLQACARVAGGPDLVAEPFEATVEFAPQVVTPVPVVRRISRGGCSVEQSFDNRGIQSLTVSTPRGVWRIHETDDDEHAHPDRVEDQIRPIDHVYWFLRNRSSDEGYPNAKIEGLQGSPTIAKKDIKRVHDLVHGPASAFWMRRDPDYRSMRPYAGAPTRARPRRTYDPARIKPDTEGDNVPTRLASLSLLEPAAWEQLKSRLEDFGRSSGLFDEIGVRQLGETVSDPFQVHIRKSGSGDEGLFRNLAEMGYGVSQVLPVVTELLRDGSPQTMLLQQPEVHLHPSVAAALGTLLCEVAADKERDRRLIVETHSDFIIDRVRMSVRDGVADLTPEDVSILYFERCGSETQIHNLGVDELGNLLDAPPGYRRFFMEEAGRFMGT